MLHKRWLIRYIFVFALSTITLLSDSLHNRPIYKLNKLLNTGNLVVIGLAHWGLVLLLGDYCMLRLVL